jgi:hypothetical protein
MTNPTALPHGVQVVMLILAVHLFLWSAPAQRLTISTEEELKAALEKTPCRNGDRLAGVKELFRSAGANPEEITIQTKHENVVVTKPGKTKETVIVGAHYDKTDDGCGEIDNWSGVVILANLYRTVAKLDTKKTFIFAAVGKEEIGLVGSDAMADAIPKEERSGICAMVNLDSFGLSFPQALRNVSDEKLIELAKNVSEEMKIPFGSAGIDIASSDSASFRAKKIPSISLHGLNDRWYSVLHTSSDTMARVNSQSVYLGYRHALVMLSKIENAPCDSFRK